MSGLTPLSFAARHGHEAVVKLLLSTEDVDPDIKDRDGRTPLLFAAEQGYEGVVKLLLLTEDVDPDTKDRVVELPFHGRQKEGTWA